MSTKTLVKVDVTREDILAARKELRSEDAQRNFCCPIAQALHRIGYDKARVTRRDICLSGDIWDGQSLSLPPEAIDFVTRFDNRGRPKPFSFEIELA